MRITSLHFTWVEAALENFPVQKQKKSFGSTCARKKKPKKRHEEQFVSPQKSAISSFNNGGQYPPAGIISQR